MLKLTLCWNSRVLTVEVRLSMSAGGLSLLMTVGCVGWKTGVPLCLTDL